MVLVVPVEAMDEDELETGPAGVLLAASGGNEDNVDRVGAVVVGVGAAVRDGVDGVRGVHEVERPAEKLGRVAPRRSCTSHSALQAR